MVENFWTFFSRLVIVENHAGKKILFAVGHRFTRSHIHNTVFEGDEVRVRRKLFISLKTAADVPES
jgi:hypothetical protein